MLVLYIDPGTGSMLISATIALFSVAFFMLKGVIYRKFGVGGDKGEALDLSQSYGLVFYSEGRQYWNVFRPLIEECGERNIPAYYFTSDLEDPGLKANIEGVKAMYIGSGREAYFALNRLKADVVVMTTPGLDVLEIKRSKSVKHYIHVSHSTSSCATYKSYGTDYYDSILVGGEGDQRLIRELESKRPIKEKEIKVIGHTYLDVLRQRLDEEHYEYTYFENKRTTVLVSPTWGSHGLLAKYGDELLGKLEEADQFNVIIRPHPQSFVSDVEVMDHLMKKYPANQNRVWDRETENLKAMAHADVMISDFSGIIFDFFTLFKKPIITFHSQFEKRGKDAIDIDDELWDIQLLNVIGKTLTGDDLPNIVEIIDDVIEKVTVKADIDEQAMLDLDKYPGESRERGMNFIEAKLKHVSVEVEEKTPLDSLTNGLNDDYTFDEYADKNSKSWIKRVFGSVFNAPMLLQLGIASGMLVAYIYLGRKLLPSQGLNQEFFTRIMAPTVLVTIALFAVCLALIWFKDKGQFSFKKQKEAFELKDMLLIALPMTPIAQYVFANQSILSFGTSILVFGYFALISIVVVVIIPWLLSPVIAKYLSTSVGMAFLYILINMASFGRTTRVAYIFLILCVLCVGAVILQFFNKKSILITLSVVLCIANAGVSGFKFIQQKDSVNTFDPSVQSNLADATANLTPKHTPDIFILVYDAYSNQETFKLYNHDNSDQVNFLLDEGFAIYDGTYSIGHASLTSTSRMLNMQPLADDEATFRKALAGENNSRAGLQGIGYDTNTVFDNQYFTIGFQPEYDYHYPEPSTSKAPNKIIRDAILEGEFRFDVDFGDMTFADYLVAKRAVLSKESEKPVFMHSHGDYPGHSQNSGVLLPNETEIHLARLELANQEMRDDIAAIQLQNRDAIVIVAGDHGAYLTKNGVGLNDDYDISEVTRDDIQDRFGTFLAIHWPDKSYAKRYPIQTIQDVMPAVFSYIYEDDSLFKTLRQETKTLYPGVISGIEIKDGIIHGGPDDGKPLFLDRDVRVKED
ncbi:MAG: CDP-glycerol glycerophosphotransferase family protein [Erysipelothrix sp.]